MPVESIWTVELSDGAVGEARKGFETRARNGFWNAFVRRGTIVDVGYSGGNPQAEPLLKGAMGVDLGTPGYNGRDLPFADGSVSTVLASHLIEHIADYGHFYRECLRVLVQEGTLILMAPLMQAYENRAVGPSVFNPDHKRFYTASRLLAEIEASLPRDQYRVLHLREYFNTNDLVRTSGHAHGPLYEIECVVQKIVPGAVYC